MYETLSLSLLQNANLPPDWMTLYVGVRGIELGSYRSPVAQLHFDDVQTFALDALAEVVGTPNEWNVYRIADAEGYRNDATVESVFYNLAKSTDVSMEAAQRRWRYAVINDVLPRIIETERHRYHDAERGNRVEWNPWYEMSSELYDLWDEWGMVSVENVPPSVEHLWDNDAETKWQATISAYNEWREREYAAIVAETERGAIQ